MSLARIAANLGLSITTVSRALGNFPDVAAATRRRVEEEAERLGYRPNLAARRLQSGRAEAIGVVLPGAPGQFDDPFFLRMLSAIGPGLARAKLDLLVMTAPPGAGELRAYSHLIEGRRVDGVLLARTRRHDERIAWLLDRGVPFVAHGRTLETRPYAHLDIDGTAACRLATERLIDFGHRRIGLVNAAESYMFAHYREAGWREALADAGLEAGPVEYAEPTEENGFRAMGAMLALPHAPTAVLCATDRLAVGALRALTHRGLRPGIDVSVIGYDNLPVAPYTDPPLTTVDQPIERAAARMVEMLLALLGGASPAEFAEIWPARLVTRGSDGPAPSGARDAAINHARGGSDEPKKSSDPPPGSGA
jgi:LacI family transcriptional regulator